MKKLVFLSFASLALFFASCGGGNNNSNTTTSSDDVTTVDENDEDENDATDDAGTAELTVSNTIDFSGNDQMVYSATKFKVKAGEPVTLSFKNAGSLPAEAMSHDVVVLKAGSDVSAFGTAVAQAKDHDTKNLDAANKGLIIAETKMLGPGQSDKITFTLSEPGVYPFLCSFPGHYGTMQGTIEAE